MTGAMKNKNWERIGFFAAGTFLGGWVLGMVGALFGRRAG